MWPTATGSPRDHGNLYTRVVKPAAEAVGLAWVGWHTLRHTCATLLIAEHGLNPKQLQTWLGHESAEFSLSLYTHLTGDDLPTVEWTRSCVHDVSTAPSKPTIRSLVNR